MSCIATPDRCAEVVDTLSRRSFSIYAKAVLRWPLHATVPTAQEHVTDEGSKVSSLVSKLRGTGRIDAMMIESVKGDMMPGTSAVVVLSTAAVVDSVARAFQGQPMELVRSDLSVPEQDRLRAAFGAP